MLGSRAVALATELNKELGLSPQKTSKALARLGISDHRWRCRRRCRSSGPGACADV